MIEILAFIGILIGVLVVITLAVRLVVFMTLARTTRDILRDPAMQEYIKRESIDGHAWWDQP